LYEHVAVELTARFGGVTAYTRSPAQGRWRSETSQQHHDDVLVVKAMVDQLDPAGWSAFRARLAGTFRQESLVVQAQDIQLF
jgi:hypothetical protein